MIRRSISTLLLALVLVVPIGDGTARAQDVDAATSIEADTDTIWPVDLTGVWNLDEKKSDDLADKLESLREKAMTSRGQGGRGGMGRGMGGGPGGGMGGGPGGGMGGGPGGGRGQRPDDNKGGPMSADQLAQAMEQLLISRLEENLEIVDGAETTSLWTPDGKIYRTRLPMGEATTKAWWDEDVLVLETTDPMRTLIQRFSLLDEKHLQVNNTITLKGGGSVKGTLVYQGA